MEYEERELFLYDVAELLMECEELRLLTRDVKARIYTTKQIEGTRVICVDVNGERGVLGIWQNDGRILTLHKIGSPFVTQTIDNWLLDELPAPSKAYRA